MQTARLYYIDGLSGVEIAEKLGISASTVSRLLNRARSQSVISFSLAEPFLACLKTADRLKTQYGLKEVIVIPNSDDTDVDRRQVALEGARYLQRIIGDYDVLGLAWGRTMSFLIQTLNPCLKANNSIVTLHGNISSISTEFNPQTLVSRVAMACGGEQYCFSDAALYGSEEELHEVMEKPENRRIMDMLEKVTVSIVGCGSLYPYPDSPILTPEYHYLTPSDLDNIRTAGACGDLLVRFIDSKGEECATDLKDRTLGISFETYRKIPTRVVVSADRNKAYAIRAILQGGLANVMILTEDLASAVLEFS